MFEPVKRKGPRAPKQFSGKLRLRVGDLVRVLSGKDRGKEGTVTRVLPGEGKVVVEGINIVTKHVKARPQTAPGAAPQESGRVSNATAIFASKVQLVVENGKDSSVSRIGIRKNAEGQTERYAKKTGSVITNG